MTLQLDFCEGADVGGVNQLIRVWVRDPSDKREAALQLESAYLTEGPDLVYLERPGRIQIYGVEIICLQIGTMVGNRYWNAYQFRVGEALRFLNLLKQKKEFDAEGWTELVEKWDALGESLTAEDFEIPADEVTEPVDPAQLNLFP